MSSPKGIPPDVRVPPRIARLPRHKGLPVPAMVQYDASGVPDFKVIDMERWVGLAQRRGCGICGAALGVRAWFVGGPKCIESRLFTDLPMHKDCAEFSLKVCPFLALPRFRYIMSNVTLPDGTVMRVNEDVSTARPDRFGLACTAGYRPARFEGSDHLMLQADPWTAVEWWQHGRPTIPPAAKNIVSE